MAMTAPKPGTVALAVVEQGDRRWTGRLAPPVVGGPPQLAFSAEDGPTKLALGSQVHLEVIAPKADVGRTSSARLTAVAHLPSVVLIEVDAENPSLWAEVVPGPVGQPADRRQWPRLAPPPDDSDLVCIEVETGPPSARAFAARIADRSSEGLGLRFVMPAEAHLCRAGSLVCWLPDETGEVVAQIGRVRHRRLLPSGVRYGVALVGPAELRTAHEALWTCGHCGYARLLAERHAHCPACGTVRGPAPCRLPDWDGLFTPADHPFSGVARTCLRCGCAWSDQARNCGHCGTRLPVDQSRPG